MSTHGDYARVFVDGWELTSDSDNISYSHMFKKNGVMPQNVGVRQFTPGAFGPSLNLAGYARHGKGVITAHNLFDGADYGGAAGAEHVITVLLGQQAAPVAGDVAIQFDGTLLPYSRPDDPNAVQKYTAKFSPRGKRQPFGAAAILISNAKGSVTSAVYDCGASPATNGVAFGGVVHTQVTTPTGVAASGSLTIAGNAVAADTVTINGTVYTFRSSLTPTAGEVLIGATAVATMQNLYQAMTGSVVGLTNGVYAAGTPAIDQTVVTLTPPTSAGTIAITYNTTGTGGNAYTLAKSGTGGLAVSGATLSGGLAGDTITSLVYQSATTSGGAYTTFATSALNGQTRAAERIEIAAGTVINEFIKVVVTVSGSTYNLGLICSFGRFWF